MLLAFGLRLCAIERQDICRHEAFSIWLSKQPLSEVMAGGADRRPLPHPLLPRFWLRLAHIDGEPQGRALPTDRRTPHETTTDNYALALAADALPGSHVRDVGPCALQTMQRLPDRDADAGAGPKVRVLPDTVWVMG
jgi:hypothetical protein